MLSNAREASVQTSMGPVGLAKSNRRSRAPSCSRNLPTYSSLLVIIIMSKIEATIYIIFGSVARFPHCTMPVRLTKM